MNATAAILAGMLLVGDGEQDEHRLFRPIDVFQLEWASDPRISPDGSQVVYVRNFMDIMTDRRRSNLWVVDFEGTNHRPLTTGNENDSSPRWSPDGSKLLYVSSSDGSTQLWCRWMDTGQTAKLTNLTRSPGGIAWSPNGKWIAFSMFVESKAEPMAKMPAPPEGAEWADAPKVIEKLRYRADGAGYLDDGFNHLFVLPADGGTPRQLTSGDFRHGGTPSWTQDSRALVFSANREEGWEYDPIDSEIYEIRIDNGDIRKLTNRNGPDHSPAVSPDGRWIAYLGFDDRLQGYQLTRLYVMDRENGESLLISNDPFDRSLRQPIWRNSEFIAVSYDDFGNGKIATFDPKGNGPFPVAADLGGTSLGRPYSGGSFTIAENGRFAMTYTRPDHPSDVGVGRVGFEGVTAITSLNHDLLSHKQLGEVEEIWYESSHDSRAVQAWIVRPPDFDPEKKYPLILEIHGGPFANYGDRFSAECQLYAAAGYVVLYVNPRGSTSYGEEFGNLIHHAYPGNDYDDLMSGVDFVLERGYVDPNNLFVTGGSGGGVLSSWIVGKTGRFRAAVVAKPVINWTSFALTSDAYDFFYKYWFPGFPWEHPEHYFARSPLSLVGNVTTPTMLLTGEQDYRTPISESEQYYQALKLRKIDTALVRIPGASHGIAARPSQLIAKVAHVLAWFERYRTDEEVED